MSSIVEFAALLFSRGVLFGILYSTLFWFQASRIDLLHQPGITFIACVMGWVLVWFVSVFNTAKPAGIIALLFLGWVTVKGSLPGIAASAETIVVSGQARAQRAAYRLAQDEPLKVPCDRTTIERQVFFTENLATGEATVRMWFSEQEGRITCWDRPGVHPRTMRRLAPVTPSIVARIARQAESGKSNRDGFRPIKSTPSNEGFRIIEHARTR